MQLAGSTAAVGFAAFAAEQVEGALNHGFGALERSQSLLHGTVSSPQLPAQFGDLLAQSESLIYLPIQTERKKSRKMRENHGKDPARPKLASFRGFYAGLFNCLNRSTAF